LPPGALVAYENAVDERLRGRNGLNLTATAASLRCRTPSFKPTYLRGLPEPLVEYIRELQPFSEGRWLAVLRELSNRDKHRHLTFLASRGEAWADDLTERQLPDGVIEVAFGIRVGVEVMLPDGMGHAVEALDALEGQVAAKPTAVGRPLTGRARP